MRGIQSLMLVLFGFFAPIARTGEVVVSGPPATNTFLFGEGMPITLSLSNATSEEIGLFWNRGELLGLSFRPVNAEQGLSVIEPKLLSFKSYPELFGSNRILRITAPLAKYLNFPGPGRYLVEYDFDFVVVRSSNVVESLRNAPRQHTRGQIALDVQPASTDQRRVLFAKQTNQLSKARGSEGVDLATVLCYAPSEDVA